MHSAPYVRYFFILSLLPVSGGVGSPQEAAGGMDPAILQHLEWRSIGPANMGGRTTDIEGVPGNPNLVYAATASGGLWKTTNAGVTWKAIFERQNTLSIGDIAVDPLNPDVVWVGTGEANTRNSVSFGDGVYKTTDGGKTWLHAGLRDSERISRIVIHPHTPDKVYVGALGHAFGPNEERGVFVTDDGGRTWDKTLYIDPEHGVADLDIDSSNPNILYAAMWRFERKPWTFTSGSEKGGVFKSLDGGRTWKKLENGLPKLLGRIGVKVAPSNPNVVYVIAETKEGTLYRSEDRGESFKQVSKQANIVSRGFYYSDLRVDPANENRVYAVASTLFVSIDGGKTFKSITGKTHIDYHALWIDPRDPRRVWQGQDGGIAVSHDRGETWEYVNNIPLGQFYHVHADNRQPFYYVMGGLQDNGSWSGPARTREPAGILNDDWRMVSFGDGFTIFNHPEDPDLYLSLSQGGNLVRTDLRTREQQIVRPYMSRGGAAANNKYRFNWNAPLVASPHDRNTVYLGGNVVFRSRDFGRTWDRISDDLTTNDPEKQQDAGGPVAPENTTAEYHCTLISLAESPLRAGTLWAGTDDGNLQVTADGGRTWSNVTKNVSGIPAGSPVSHVEPSRADADRVYAAFDRHMLDDFRPYVFRSADGGKSWTNVAGDLPPKAYVHVVREDPKNPNLIYAGTELGLFASHNGGGSWIELNLKNLPGVSVHDLLVHPRENDLILGTHGRSIWILDDASPLQQLSGQITSRDVHLFAVRPALRHAVRFTRYGIGDKVFAGPNPPYGALITYSLGEKPAEKATVKIEVLEGAGKVIRTVEKIPREKGLNRTSWDLRYDPPKPRRERTEGEEPSFAGPPRGPHVLPGTYTVRLTVGEKTFETPVEVRMDTTVPAVQKDLQSQRDTLLRIRDMQTATNAALKALDNIKEQLEQKKKMVQDLLTDPAKELQSVLSERVKEIDSLQAGLANHEDGLGFRGSQQVAENLRSLFSSIDGANAAPTTAQMEYLGEVQALFRQRMQSVNTFVAQSVPALNETLRRLGASGVLAGMPIDLPR